MTTLRRVLGLAAIVLGAGLLRPGAAGGQVLEPDVPPTLFELDQPYILPWGTFHGYVNAGAHPLVGDGDLVGPVLVGAKIGAYRVAQVELELRDRVGADLSGTEFDPLNPQEDLPPDTADDARFRGGVRVALPARPLDVISASASLITPIRGDETVLLEATLGAAHRLGGDGPIVAGQVLHRRGVGSDEGPAGGDIKSTSVGALAMVRGGPLFWSVEGRYQVNAGEQPSAGRLTPGVHWTRPAVNLAVGVPVVFRDGVRAGLTATVGVTLGWNVR